MGDGEEDLKSAKNLKNVAPKIFDEHIIDLTNKINYRQSAAVLSLCNMYIGNDTSTMHIAAALNLPVLCANCFAADIPLWNTDVPRRFHPYGVPSVIVQPKHALPECKNVKSHNDYGCIKIDDSHCIAQIEPTTLLKGFHLLKERAVAQIYEPLYIRKKNF